MTRFIRSSARGAKPDPMYYVRKVRQLRRQRDRLQARENELDPTGGVIDTPEGKSLDHRIHLLSDRIGYYLRLYPTAVELFDRQAGRRTHTNPAGTVTYWPTDPWNQPGAWE